MANAVTLSVQDGLATIRLGREHGNAINDEVVDGLMSAAQEAEADPSVRGVLLAASGKLFSPGLDLQELILLDAAQMKRFIDRFNASLLTLYTFPKPMVAAIHGHAIAGGCVLTLTADWRMLMRGRMVGLNEIRVGVPLPFGVSMILRETVGRAHLEEVALFGRNYRDEGAIAAGLAHELLPEEQFESTCLERLGELAEKDLRAFAITKRYLRAATVERIRANDRQFTHDFLDAWFSPPTRERIEAIVQGLSDREG